MDDDRALVQAVLAGRADAFEVLVRRHQALVWHVIQRMVQQHDDSLELSQETFLRAYRRIEQFRFDSSLATWIGRIAFSIAARHLERKRLPMVEPSDADSPDAVSAELPAPDDTEALVIHADLNQHVAAALQALPPLPRTLITLYHLDELSVAEIAAICDMPEGTVKNSLFRARKALRERLNGAMEEAE